MKTCRAAVLLAILAASPAIGALPELTEKYRFLAALHLSGVSPAMDVLAVAAALAARGHEVASVLPTDDLPFSQAAAARHGGGRGADAIRWLPFDMPFTVQSGHMKEMAKSAGGMKNPFKLLLKLQNMLARPCAILMANETLLQELEAARYSAVLTYNFPGDTVDSCGCVLAHKLRVPLLTVYGIPFLTGPLSVPQFGSGLSASDLSTWRGRARNLLYYIGTQGFTAVLGAVSARGLSGIRAAHHLPRRGPGGTCTPLVQLCAVGQLLEPPRPVGLPKVIIGPVAPRPAHPTIEPAAADAFVSSAPAGVAVLSWGSSPIFGTFLTRRDVEELVAAFADLAPLRVVWLLKPKNLPEGLTLAELDLAPNVQTFSWVDINDLLGHPNVRLFVTHGGYHSAVEAVFHGVPVVAVPFQFEQAENSHRLAHLGVGEVSPEAPALRAKGQTYTRAGMRDLALKVLNTPSYAAAAKRASAAAQLLAASRPTLQAAVAEVEAALLLMGRSQYKTYRGGRGAALGEAISGAGGCAADGGAGAAHSEL